MQSNSNRRKTPVGLSQKSDAVVAALSGAPEETVRALSYLPTYERRMASAEAFGGDYETESPPGLLMKTFDYLTRPQSMITGFTTGLLGMDRVENERRTVGPNVIREDETNFQAGMRRAYEASKGEEYFTFRDFGKLSQAASDKDASIWDRSIAATFGFGLDIIMDPLTYVSFGGSILGRRYASKFLSTADTGLDGAMRAAHRNKDFNYKRFFSEAIDENVIDERILVGRLQSSIKEVARSTDTALNQNAIDDLARALNSENVVDAIIDVAHKAGMDKGVNYLSMVALETAPEAAGLMYAARGSKNMRAWANRQFGSAGEAWFQSLGQDIKGGVRIRLPFYRDATGAPKAWALKGIGAGEISSRSPLVNRMTDLSENARNWVASKTGRLTAKMSGRAGELWVEAVGAARGKLARDGTVTFADYRTFEKSFDMAEQLGIIFDDRITKDYMQGQYNFNAGMSAWGEKFRRQFDILFHNEQELKTAELHLRNGSLVAYTGSQEGAQVAQSAIATARVWRDLLNDIGRETIEVFGDAEVAMNFLRNHVPRMTEARFSAIKAAQSGSAFRASSGTPDISKTRHAFAGEWYVTEENGAQVIRWLTETEANRFLLGTPQAKEIMGPLYVEDPTKFLPMYIAEVRSSLRDYRITNELHRAGLFVDLPQEQLREFNITDLWGQVVELVSPRHTGQVGRMTEPRLEEYRKLLEKYRIPKLADEPQDFFERARSLFDILRDTVRFQEPYTLPNNSIMYRELISFEDATGYRIPMDEGLVSALGLWKRPDWQVIKDQPRFYNPLDNSYIEALPVVPGDTPGSAGWVIKVGRGRNPTEIRRPDGGAFSDRMQAAEFMRRENALQYRVLFVNYVSDMQRLAIDNTKAILNEVPNIAHYLVSPQRLSQASDIVEEQQMIQEAIEYLYSIAQRFGRAEGIAQVSRAGRPVMVSPSLATVDDKIPVEMIGWAQRQGFVDITGVDLDTGARDAYLASMEVRGRIAEALSADYGPKKLMETIGRLYQVRQSPTNSFQDFIENVYKPFYAVQKVGMTLFRGVGFVHRNIMGGLWLGYLNGVGAAETLPASSTVIAAARALKQARRQLGADFDANPLEAARLMKENFEATIRKQFTGSDRIIQGQSDADAILDLWEKFHKNGLDGRRRTSRVMGEILDSSSAMGRTGGIRLQRDPNSRASDYLKVDTDRGSFFVLEEELSKVDTVLRMAIDNPWINFVSGYAEMSEDFLRFAAYIRSAKDIGTRDGGYAASLFVKATHFDYADLSAFERDYLKLLFPFYTWMRYNIPMQFRTLMHDPSRMTSAIKLQQSLAYIFSNDSEDQYPYASYVAERFGFTIPESTFANLPDILRPAGPVSLGMMWGEPAIDLNRMFRVPGQFTGSAPGRIASTVVNPRELFGMMNPLLATGAGAFSGYSRGEPALVPGQTEPAPKWMAWAVTRTDPRTGEKVVGRVLTETLRGIFPQLSVIERLAAPIAGGERQEGRWSVAVASALTGFSFAVEDDFKAASEILRRNTLLKQQFDTEFGESAEYRQLLVQKLLDAGASMDYIRALDIPSIPDEALDVDQYVSAYYFIQAVGQALNLGIPEEDIALSLSTYLEDPEQGPQVRALMSVFARRYVSDARRRVRMFGLQNATEDDLRRVGLSPRDVRGMSRAEQEELIRILGQD
jgi:hypothetical protein